MIREKNRRRDPRSGPTDFFFDNAGCEKLKNVASFSAVPLCLSSPRLYAASLPVPDPAVPAK